MSIVVPLDILLLHLRTSFTGSSLFALCSSPRLVKWLLLDIMDLSCKSIKFGKLHVRLLRNVGNWEPNRSTYTSSKNWKRPLTMTKKTIFHLRLSSSFWGWCCQISHTHHYNMCAALIFNFHSTPLFPFQISSKLWIMRMEGFLHLKS